MMTLVYQNIPGSSEYHLYLMEKSYSETFGFHLICNDHFIFQNLIYFLFEIVLLFLCSPFYIAIILLMYFIDP